MPERGSLGFRFFSTSRAHSIRKSMKSTLSNLCHNLQEELTTLRNEDGDENVLLKELLPKSLTYVHVHYTSGC